MGVAAHLLDATFFVLLAMLLYSLLQHVHKGVAWAMLLFVVLAVGIITLNAVFLFEGLQVATNSTYAAAFGVAGSNALVLLLLDIQHFGTLSAQLFFGPVARAIGLSRHQIKALPQVARHQYSSWGRLLPHRPLSRPSWSRTLAK